jgi:HAD superfamily hydrolase (TIGR01490 family)
VRPRPTAASLPREGCRDVKLTLFDLDGTLIPTDSDHAFGEFLVQAGWADREHFKQRNDAFYADYLAGTIDVAAYIDFATAAWRERPLHEALALRERFMREVMQPALRAPALELVRRHQAAGDRTAIVTATNEFITRPIADLFGVETLLAVELERDASGRVTGRMSSVPTFREGKVRRVEQWLGSLGHAASDFERITCYSDSINDLPLLEWATDPVATNPSTSLAAVAAERGWSILHLFERTE